MGSSVPGRGGGVNDRCPTILASNDTADRHRDAATVTFVDVRIAVNHSPREVTVEVPDDERDDVNAKIEAALSGSDEVLWLVDKRGRRVGVPSANIAYIEVGTPDGDRRIGFGG
jgi:hypothetical protein